jgi:signal transduction histidine kinase
VTLLTVLLVGLTLSLYGFLSLRSRRVEVTADLERQTRLFGSALTASLEAALQDGLYEDTRGLIQRMQAAEQSIDVVYLDLIHPVDNAAFGHSQGPAPPPPPDAGSDSDNQYRRPAPDPRREERLRRVQITGQPYSEHTVVDGREVFAYMFPLRASQHQQVAAVDLIRDKSDLEQEMARTTRDTVLTLGSLFVLLALLVGLSVRQELTGPLLRLVGGIDEVSRGDYTGAILRERSDEVGLLADRFNEMTRSLRNAREQILTGVDAKLQLEMRLRHSDKLATIGQLAAGIAHEVGTPLNVIGGRARVMARRADDPQAVQKNADIIATQAERITKIIQQLLDYARRKAPARSEVDLRKVCTSTLDFLEHQLATRGVEAALHPFAVAASQRNREHEEPGEAALPLPATPHVMGDADQLQQVCLNLCINAVQAMPEGGKLDLHLEGIVRRKPGLDKATPGGYILLAVADTGIGIAEAHLGRIFEPFYSTKTWPEGPSNRRGVGGAGSGAGSSEGPAAETTSGSGLGLSVSAGIVKDHDGWIEIERRPTGGTIFRVFLPALEGEPDLARTGSQRSAGNRGYAASPSPSLSGSGLRAVRIEAPPGQVVQSSGEAKDDPPAP